MGMSKGFALVLVLVFLTALCVTAVKPAKAQLTTIIVPDNYPTISDAIGNATNGDTILVRSGTYQEQVLEINKSISLIGKNANTTNIILHPPSEPLFGDYAVMIYDNAIQINANQVIISGFTISTDGGSISVNGTDSQISGNNLNIEISGTGDGTQIIGNNFNGLSQSYISITGSNQLIAQNTLTGADISCEGSFNRILNNTISLSQSAYEYGIKEGYYPLQGIQLSGSSNLVLNNTIVYGSINLAGDSDYNFIEKNNCGSISISSSYNNTVCGNYISGTLGFVGSYNIFYGNYMQGIELGNQYMDTPNNTFYENNFDFTDGKNVLVYVGVLSSLIFDNGTVGNYWSDYLTEYPNATEIDNSGIGDTPYVIYFTNGNNSATGYTYVLSDIDNYTLTLTDRYPLMSPVNISSIQIQLPTWANTTVPSPLPTPSFPPQNLLTSSQPSPASSQASSSTQSTPKATPEFPSLIILTLFMISSLFIAVVLMLVSKSKKTKN